MLTAALPALVLRTARAVRWHPVAAGAVVGLAVVSVAALPGVRLDLAALTTVLRLAALSGALGAAFVLDDPGWPTTATVPVSQVVRRMVRLLLLLPPYAAWWALVLAVARAATGTDVAGAVPAAGLTIEAAGLLALALAAAAAGSVHRSAGGLPAATVLLVTVAALRLSPVGPVLFADPGASGWSAGRRVWAGVAASALLAVLYLSALADRPARSSGARLFHS